MWCLAATTSDVTAHNNRLQYVYSLFLYLPKCQATTPFNLETSAKTLDQQVFQVRVINHSHSGPLVTHASTDRPPTIMSLGPSSLAIF